jgi:2-desacetyl-2-hydroxyethyl bacteriochlorophyllide A dehydrogenase
MKSKYVVFPEPGSVRLETEQIGVKDLQPLEAVIENEVSIISTGTELARLHGLGEATFPARPGYGSIGRIVARGSALTDFPVGARVFYAGKHASIQRFLHGQGHQWAHLFPVPEGDPLELVVACMAQIAMTAPNVTELRIGDTVAVFGLGMVGNLAAQLYRLRGARVIGLDPVERRADLAKRCGIQYVISMPADKQVQAVRAATDGQGADVSVDAVGDAGIITNCVDATRLLGQIVLVGTPRAPLVGDLANVFNRIHEHGLVVRGAHMWRMPVTDQRGVAMSVSWAFSRVFSLISEQALKVRELVSHVIVASEAAEAYAGLKEKPNEYTGVVIDWR